MNGPNAVASGIFFGQSSILPPPASAGAYITRFGGIAVSSTTSTVAKLTLPAGTYLFDARVTVQVFGTSTNTVLCGITDPTNRDIDAGAVTLNPFHSNGSDNPIGNITLHNIATILQSGTITLTCQYDDNSAMVNVVEDKSSVLTAIPIPSVITQGTNDHLSGGLTRHGPRSDDHAIADSPFSIL